MSRREVARKIQDLEYELSRLEEEVLERTERIAAANPSDAAVMRRNQVIAEDNVVRLRATIDRLRRQF